MGSSGASGVPRQEMGRECGLTWRSSRPATAGRLARVAGRCAHFPPRRQAVLPPRSAQLYVRPCRMSGCTLHCLSRPWAAHSRPVGRLFGLSLQPRHPGHRQSGPGAAFGLSITKVPARRPSGAGGFVPQVFGASRLSCQHRAPGLTGQSTGPATAGVVRPVRGHPASSRTGLTPPASAVRLPLR